ncbi:hypothetical protein F5X68DRAFT_32259 [Plectosphaerella plurivora]|uniref:Uncharacterized protein n=1 Tax=Plectosphaerella plurivora TaxID=936078 RepID=A0A9P9AHT9_9PEZI|nr:hypothetical protein F5X68DRAFT_32259 [Plectosphaerella plurivora]
MRAWLRTPRGIPIRGAALLGQTTPISPSQRHGVMSSFVTGQHLSWSSQKPRKGGRGVLCLFSSTRGSPATWQFRYRISGKLPNAWLSSVIFPAAVESTPTRGHPAASPASSSCASPTGRADLPIARTKVAFRTPDDTMPCRRQCNLEAFPHSSRNHVPCAILAFHLRCSHWLSADMSSTSGLGSKTMKIIKVGPCPSVLSARPRTRPGNVDLTRLETPSKTCPPVMSRSRLPSPGALGGPTLLE